MRRIVGIALNVGGVALLIAAALLAWTAYNPDTPAPPPDVTIVTAGAPAPELPLAEPPVSAPLTAQAPLLLPETKLPEQTPAAASAQSAPTGQFPDGVPGPAERKASLDILAAERARAFPPPADTLPTRIVLPTIDVDSVVVPVGWTNYLEDGQTVSEWDVADYAVGFQKTTALPGAAGNTVMAGHNNIKGEVFKNLIDLKLGDDIFVYAGQHTYRYVVAQKLLVKEQGVPLAQRLQNAQWIAPTDDVRLTLVSCWPYTSNTYRVIIVAKPAA